MSYFWGVSSFFSYSVWVVFVGFTCGGFSLGASISMAYVLIGLRTSGRTTAELSGMSQSAGYYLASIGPILVGLLFDIAVSWNLFIMIMIGSAIAFTYLGSEVGRDRKV